MTMAVEARGLGRRFGSTDAVRGVDLQVGPGVVGLLGPNGAGKTTLLRMLATVLAPSSGSLRLLGRDPDVPADRLEIRRRLGYLPQEPGLYQGFTAFDLVDYVAVLKEITDTATRRDEVRRVLEMTGLAEQAHRRIRNLSGGTRHRVALAAALLGDPPLLLLDEPAAGLDPEHRLQLRSILSEAGTRGTVLVSTHLTAEAADMCREVVVMLDGGIAFQGPPADLAALATDRVWVDDTPLSAVVPGRSHAWVRPDGLVCNVGEPPPGADLVEPTVDLGYLVLAAGRGGAGGADSNGPAGGRSRFGRLRIRAGAR
jgi:ABC-2 type transport system ATP-binding protein